MLADNVPTNIVDDFYFGLSNVINPNCGGGGAPRLPQAINLNKLYAITPTNN